MPQDERKRVLAQRRVRWIAAALGLVFAAIVGRVAQVALSGGEGGARTVRDAREIVRRADIVDRKGDLLATSLPAWSISADPRAIWDAKEVANGIARALPGVDAADIAKRLSDKSRHFVWIARGLTPRQRQAVFDLGLEGLQFKEELRRVYPGGKLAGHLLGYTDIDQKGVEGVERAFDDRLRAKDGKPLRLTIDAGVQYALESELEAAQEDFTMTGAAGVVIEAQTGAVRAIASWPAIDPNRPKDSDNEARQNRAMNAIFELGSIFKPHTVAAALEAGMLGLDETFDVSKPIKVGGIQVHDAHKMDHAEAMTAADIIAHSSNIGVVQISQRVGAEKERAFLDSVGLLGRLDLDGMSTAAPLTPQEWDAATTATVSFGHGVAVSPLAFAMSFVPFATGGDYLAPHILEPVVVQPDQRRHVMSAPTARVVNDMMRRTVLVGTGKLADAPGYEVAGKTGTAEKFGDDGYDANRNVTSFAAVFPVSRPQFVVLIVLDEAQARRGDGRTASVTAAAIAGRFVARAAPLLDVAPVMTPPPTIEPVKDTSAVNRTRAL